jgi:hypothetical protein
LYRAVRHEATGRSHGVFDRDLGKPALIGELDDARVWWVGLPVGC